MVAPMEIVTRIASGPTWAADTTTMLRRRSAVISRSASFFWGAVCNGGGEIAVGGADQAEVGSHPEVAAPHDEDAPRARALSELTQRFHGMCRGLIREEDRGAQVGFAVCGTV